MILSYRFKNHFSFGGETEVSFQLSNQVPETDRVCVSPSGARLSKLMAVIGPNGSGKTSALKPLAFLHWFVCSSFANSKPGDEIPVEPHFFSDLEDSEFEVVFEADGKLYRYNLIVNRRRVVHEAIYLKTSKFFSYLFRRDWSQPDKKYFIRQQKFGMAPKEASKVRDNASLISTAAQYNVPCAQALVDFFGHIYTNVHYEGREHFATRDIFSAAEFFHNQPKLKQQMSDLMCRLDLGLADVVIEKHKLEEKPGKVEEINMTFGIHRSDKKEVKLPFWSESSGTQRAYVLLKKMLAALSDGGIVVIDEMEADMHPDMLNTLLDLFINPETNPHDTQIIFTCHAHEVLNLLDKSQVLLIEKDENGVSQAWRLDEMQGVRRDDNLYAKYRAGAYGAVPNL